MTAHCHPDPSVLTVACPECIRATRAREEEARWEQAPLRLVKFECSFIAPGPDGGVSASLSFALKLEVPLDATGDEVDEHYIDEVGDAFLMALPEDLVPMVWTDLAAETMVVEKVTIGAPIELEPAVGVPQPPLFGADL